MTQPPYSPDLAPCDLDFSQKTKIILERKEILDHRWDSGKYEGAANSKWENCVRSQAAYFGGAWGAIVLCIMFLVSSSINVSIFHITWLDTFRTDLIRAKEKLNCVVAFEASIALLRCWSVLLKRKRRDKVGTHLRG